MPKEEELDIEVVDDLNGEETIEIEDEDTDTSDEESELSVEDNTPSTKSKKSNWKKMSQELKAAKKKIAELESGDYDSEDDDDDEENNQGQVDENKLTRFLMKNKEALDYEDGIVETLKQFPNMSFDQAFTFTKANNSESTSSKSFTTKSVKQTKKISELTEEQALRHFKGDNAGMLNWRRATGKTRF